ncbi:D-sedoheptulose-7-phosphate isomerase [Aggregatibacter actinomycetemcomitans]|uniref:D-sedoheptulose-7-phosphate isomerase n=1 Tax=Aggregatibacter actinomycetemcomitans TaxID=714 RepID=UPI00197CA687|nr:SIS domain-containing protein [Aggregatibacter actinomycetemcomitans]MBN6064110.1 SIS domain-containing protein [Aggregatibacter actinomycetemcomitans]MBN6076377.1 SIS domain-containing protein [Aggregatibacter actinomycetemcomitans]MBN6082176.1 SIS domain-containing protein [Aggregatibacter actinomycetemcomitans]MBN6083642.1 SIS domain-containing protein [Aggregatibacter actinomycetemcomitans]
MQNKLNDLYEENIKTHIYSKSLLSAQIVEATQHLIACLLRGNKVIVCGDGRSYINAQCLVANLLNRYELKRPSFPSVLLSLDSAVGSTFVSDNTPEKLYQHQFNAIARSGDILVAFAPLGNENNVLNTVTHAVNKEINVIVLTGNSNDHIQGILTDKDLQIAVPSSKESRILENHLFIINSMCELIDFQLFSHS